MCWGLGKPHSGQHWSLQVFNFEGTACYICFLSSKIKHFITRSKMLPIPKKAIKTITGVSSRVPLPVLALVRSCASCSSKGSSGLFSEVNVSQQVRPSTRGHPYANIFKWGIWHVIWDNVKGVPVWVGSRAWYSGEPLTTPYCSGP